MSDTDFSVEHVIEEQMKHDNKVFHHTQTTNWLAYMVLIFNILSFLFFVIYFFVHRHHYSIQKTLNKIA